MGRWLKWAGVMILTLCVVLGVAVYAVFGGLRPADEGELVGLGYALVDTYVTVIVIVVGDGKLLLVDAGNDPTGAPILAALAQHDQAPDDVVAVLLTHGHRDHVAALDHFPNAQVLAMEQEAPYLRGEVPYKGPLPALFGVQPARRVTTWVQDGDIIEIGTRRIEAIHLPGHTAGSTAWLIDDALFLGDSASFLANGDLIGAPWVFSDDTAQNRASLAHLADRLAGRTVRRTFTSHAGSADGMGAIQAFAHASGPR